MLTAERRARKTGKLIADGSTPLASKELTGMKIKKGVPHRWLNAVLPISAIIGVLMLGLYLDGVRVIMSEGDATLVEAVKASRIHLIYWVK